jgi:hypothetical protein
MTGFTDTEVEALARHAHKSKATIIQRVENKRITTAKRIAKADAKREAAIKRAAVQMAKVKRVGNKYSY